MEVRLKPADIASETERDESEARRVEWSKRELAPGTRLLDRFEIEGKLGQGGMGMVFSVWDNARETRVALKILGELSPAAIRQIKREFRAAAELVHPNLVRLHELFSSGPEWFFTMDLVDGVMLPALLASSPPGETELLRRVLGQLAIALCELHRRGTLHGDLKPSNFLICGPEQRVVLLDFGLARPLGPAQQRELAGTPAYMAPEQAMGQVLTEAADWYSFGVILYEALTGELPLADPSGSLLERAPADLKELCLDLLAIEPGERPSGERVRLRIDPGEAEQRTSFVAPVPRPVLVDRRTELAALDAAFERMASGEPGIMLVHGPSGIGKTALLEHFAERARRRNACVLVGRCRERESMGYKAIDGLIDDLVTVLDGLKPEVAAELIPEHVFELTILFPALRLAAAVAATASAQDGSPDQGIVRERAIAAFRQLLARLRRRAPLVIWLDDLQWSDEESAPLLGRLLELPDPVPLLLIASHRSEPGGSGPLLRALFQERDCALPTPIVLPIGPLNVEDAGRLALELLPRADADAATLAGSIVREAAGHPLFIAELVHSRVSDPDASRAPSNIADLVARRIDQLDRVARSFLELAAVSGAPRTRAALRRAQGLTPSEADAVIDVLRANRLVRSTGLRDADSIDTHHDRIREVVIERLDAARRSHCHSRLAQVLEHEPVNREVVAAHYEAAGNLERAAHHYLAAADNAFRALAFQHAADLYGQGLRLAELGPEARRLLSIRRAEALAYAGKGVHAAELYLETAASCAPDLGLELQRRAAEQLLLSGHLDRGRAVIEQVLQTLGMPRMRTGRRALLGLVAGRLLARVRGLRHVPREEREVPSTELARVDASWTVACSLSLIDFIPGADFQNRHMLLALRAGEPKRLLRALTLEISYAATPGAGSEKRTARLLAVAEDLAKTRADHIAFSLLHLTRGIAAYLQGQTAASLRHCENALAILTRHCAGAVWETVTAQRFAIASLFFLGELRRLAEFVPPLLAGAETTGNRYATMCFSAGYSTAVWLAQDNVAEARRQLSRVRDEWKAPGFQLSHYNLLIGETFVDIYCGEVERARARLVEQWPAIAAAQFLRIGVLRVQLWHLRAICACGSAATARAHGHSARARTLQAEARRAAHRLRTDPMRRAFDLSELILAMLDHAAGEVELAKARLERCHRAFTQQDLRLFAAAARVRLGQIVEGESGSELVRTGMETFTLEGVADPERLIAIFAPGTR